ncbi:DNA-binding transcriptional MerR regulator [Geomicrobium halophilum]|uniref:DNA-binding transcriptional MerR regulator n=1 Tax=Geomicrobium halophilum TaxID=549000 RepID=A0A841PQU4_9BACL|nr:MerR family transcriptional regulator [Geomicrobium halophilum]MBB6451160.1 DNA-binding transcriptional MerR regulator [Geomicrobium halophilum]
MLRVKEVADLVGISVRTLHHYDDIGLLTPEKTTEAGYRLYSSENLETLQQILFFRALDFPLKQIRDIVQSPSFDQEEALLMHRKMLLAKRQNLDQMIKTIDKSLQHVKGEVEMTDKEKFAGFDFIKNNAYEKEARERWGDEAVDQSNEAIANMSDKKQEALNTEINQLYRDLAAICHNPPDSPKAQSLIHEWYRLLNEIGDYSMDAFKGLGELYVSDERFTNNIDQFGEGLAIFMREAMRIYADRRK